MFRLTGFPIVKLLNVFNRVKRNIKKFHSLAFREIRRAGRGGKMTEAPAETTGASHINDLSHKGTVPLPKANGPTSKGSGDFGLSPLEYGLRFA